MGRHLKTDGGFSPYFNKYRLSKKRGVRFLHHAKSPCEVFIMECLFMLLRLVLANPNEEFKGTDTTMLAAWEDKTKRKNGKRVIVGNEITTPSHKFIKLYVELTACNFLFNHFGPISNAGRKFQGLGSTSSHTKLQRYLRHNQQVIIDTLHRWHPRMASKVFPRKRNTCSNDVHQIYSKRLSLKNKLKHGTPLGVGEMDESDSRSMYMHHRYLSQALMIEADWTVSKLDSRLSKYLKIDNTMSSGNLVWLGKEIELEDEDSDSLDSMSSDSSSSSD
jgi:hypothetical protein